MQIELLNGEQVQIKGINSDDLWIVKSDKKTGKLQLEKM